MRHHASSHLPLPSARPTRSEARSCRQCNYNVVLGQVQQLPHRRSHRCDSVGATAVAATSTAAIDAPNNAMASTPATRDNALSTPEAVPAAAVSTDFITV